MSKRFATQPKAAATQPTKSAQRNTKKSVQVKSEPPPATPKNISAPGLDNALEPGVSSHQLPTTTTHAAKAAHKEHRIMDLTFNRSTAARKDDRLVIFNFADGRPGSVQFLRTAFGPTVPNTITMAGDFAVKSEKVAKDKETPEARKARLASLPKLTLAERVAKAEERAAKLREKLTKVAA